MGAPVDDPTLIESKPTQLDQSLVPRISGYSAPKAFRSSKTFGHDLGLSAAFRQWRAQSHCRFIHGYSLSVRLEFEADSLDERNWVVDFGSFKDLKQFLTDTFDHKLLVAEDDPMRETMEALDQLGLAQVKIVPATGCERFAELIYNEASKWLKRQRGEVVRLVSVEVREHGGNGASYGH